MGTRLFAPLSLVLNQCGYPSRNGPRLLQGPGFSVFPTRSRESLLVRAKAANGRVRQSVAPLAERPTGSWHRNLVATMAAVLLGGCGGDDHDLTGAWQGLGRHLQTGGTDVPARMVLDDDGSGRSELLVEVSSPVSQLTWAVEGDRVLLLYDCREEEQYMALTQCVPTPDAFHSCLVESDGDALAWPGAPPGAAMIRRSSGRATRTNRR